MCLKCLKEDNPKRGNVVMDSGAYMVNYAGCAVCSNKDIPMSVQLQQVEEEEEEDSEEEIENEKKQKKFKSFKEETRYQHICRGCKHVIAMHWASFAVSQASASHDASKKDEQEINKIQDFQMNCKLCGHGNDTRAVITQGKTQTVINEKKDDANGSSASASTSTISMTNLFSNISIPDKAKKDQDESEGDWD